MRRRTFLKAGGVVSLAASAKPLLAHIPPHNFDKYDFGGGPPVSDRLYQGPFSADDYPSWNVVMALTPSREVVPNYGMGLITYLCDEVGPGRKDGEALAQSIKEHGLLEPLHRAAERLQEIGEVEHATNAKLLRAHYLALTGVRLTEVVETFRSLPRRSPAPAATAVPRARSPLR